MAYDAQISAMPIEKMAPALFRLSDFQTIIEIGSEKEKHDYDLTFTVAPFACFPLFFLSNFWNFPLVIVQLLPNPPNMSRLDY